MRSVRRAVLIALFLAAPAHAQLINENLLVTMPPGFKVGFQDQKNNMRLTEMVPPGETVENWTEMVTVQVFLGLKTSPQAFKERIEQGWLAACKEGGAHAVSDDPESGYPALIWVLSCPRNPATGKPEITWFKAVAGNDSFYVVQKAFRFMPVQEQMTKALAYLGSVKVCDSRRADRACPATRP
ncbi:MAG: hypothetical protein JO205_07835 [Pseudolabrys sp.]|nr:hypothetical protein [Pseudolabrys sp.]